MMRDLILALGLMAAIEGLVLALAPLRFEDFLKALSQMGKGQRQAMGLAILAVGVVLVWVSKSLF